MSLSREDVAAIRALPQESNVALARRFGVSRQAVAAVRANRTHYDPDYRPVQSRFRGRPRTRVG